MPSIAFMITSSPTDNLTVTALNLIQAAIEKNITIKGVFFYQAGVLNASRYINLPSDEYAVHTQWGSLANKYKLPLYLCATAAEKYGLLDSLSLKEIDDKLTSNIAQEFTVSGLSELVSLTLDADRVIQL